MGKFGRTPINDAGKPRPRLAYTYNGEQRIENRPSGIAEKFVDAQGTVVTLQLASAGAPAPQDLAAKMRVRFHAEGFVEHGKCPLKHGVRFAHAKIERDFVEMPEELQRPCEDDPRPLVRRGQRLEARDSCPHVEWLIQSRRDKVAVEYADRNAARLAKEREDAQRSELVETQLEIAREELEARRAKRIKPKPAE